MTNKLKISIIGIPNQELIATKNIEDKIDNADYYAGGKRHYQLVKQFLPGNHQWTDITVPLSLLFEEIKCKSGHWVIFASGDPLFFGIGNTLLREFPTATIDIEPCFNSLQTLAHRTNTPYGLHRVVSLTGRKWDEFDASLIKGESRLAILTDREKTPATIAKRMAEYGYTNYNLTIGENLGSSNEKIHQTRVLEATDKVFENPNCLFITKTTQKKSWSGIPDNEFNVLPNRPGMITKMPIRLTTLALMELHHHSVLWDIGACTGSISIEAKIQAPKLSVHSFEIRPECEEIITNNCRKFGVPGINLHIADFLDFPKEHIEQPDMVFLGGYGGKMEAVLDCVNNHLCQGGIIAFNAVTNESCERFTQWADNNNYSIKTKTTIAVDNFNPISIVIIRKENE